LCVHTEPSGLGMEYSIEQDEWVSC
jgi:hypothetical protein